MTEEVPIQRVEVSFVGNPPVRQIECAAGVSEVQVEGATLHCLVCGSFQSFLEAIRGHEVISLKSTLAKAEGDHESTRSCSRLPSAQ